MVESTQDEDEVLFRASQPRKIGILSSGEVSNIIVRKIQNDHSNMFKDNTFDTFFGMFNPGPESETPETSESAENVQKIPELPELIETEGMQESQDGYDIEAPAPIEHKNRSSFRMRAHELFQQLKRRLGILKDRPKSGPDPTATYDPEPRSPPEPSEPQEPSEPPEPHEPPEPEIDEIKDEEGPVIAQTIPEISDIIGKSQKKPDPSVISLLPDSDDVSKPLEDLVEDIKDKELLFIITCLDDENDIKNASAILDRIENMDVLTILIASLPRYFSKVENVYAMNKILQRLRLQAELVILLPYYEAFEFKLIPKLILELMELITKPGLINVDVADLKIIVKGGNVAVISFGMGRRETRVKDAFFEALDSKLLHVELGGVKKVLLNITGGQDMTLSEVEAIANQIKSRISSDATLIMGTCINPDLRDKFKIFLLLGVTPMQVMVNRYANE